MVRLRLAHQRHKVEDEFLVLPDAQPVTLHQIDSSSLPYACQCPLCGGLFELPTGILYKIEDDDIDDRPSGVNTIGPSNRTTNFDNDFFEGPDMMSTPMESATEFSEQMTTEQAPESPVGGGTEV